MAVLSVIGVLGLMILGLGIVAGVVAGGVPYPDGPNAGFVSPPGWRRWLEHACMPIAMAGVALASVAGVGLGVVGVWVALKRL